ncbi:MAG: glutamine synthetase family protein [Atopobiaceae bacterium]|jgi:glutamine synthetase|nr:glutamine synthetase family protein [Atopobiaceae bacterium]MCH4120012.1 glutamine synthetase family protein [Atopobiaceae bacterium]MCI1318914.1 glutamine synthetase family protein [Atopobiaceae bacterium]MCI1389371.1 glutamine synthetase family protein [Atopobiaceae bacterium]MCI1432434.1 glutamine synthetase family protein [Atopobiaceae bacterium]
MATDQNVDFVLRTVEGRDIRFIRLWFTDMLGNLKSFSISPEDLEEAFDEGVGFDGSAVDGFAHREESDMLAFPDPATFQVLPWRPKESGVARMFCDIKTPEFEPFDGDPRACLRRVFRAADAKGLVANVGPEIEYFYFADSKVPRIVDDAGYFDLTPWDSAHELRRDTTLTLEKMSIPVEYSFHAESPSQNCVELRYAEALSCADNIMTARLVIKQMASENDMFASFMPKPFSDAEGSGMFLQQSLFDHDGNNVFWQEEERDGLHLSDLARSYIAGLIKYAPEYLMVTNPTVNSYKRLAGHPNVPGVACWGRRNRSALVRIPTYKPGKPLSTRVQLRCPDPTCNPYLGIAATIAAGLKGIEDGLELGPELLSCDADLSVAELRKKGFTPLPRSLGEAADAFEASDLMRETLGEHIFSYLLNAKRAEWEEYNATVTEWEREHYYAGF